MEYAIMDLGMPNKIEGISRRPCSYSVLIQTGVILIEIVD